MCSSRVGSILVATLLLSMPAFASYTFTQKQSLADNTGWCGTNNCLTSIGGVTAETKAGADGAIYGLTSSHVLYTYTRTGGWVVAASVLQSAGGYPIMHISVGSASSVLALSTAPSSNVYVLNAAHTAWQSLTGWLSFAEIGADGSLWGVNLTNSTIYSWNGSSWVIEPGLVSNIAVGVDNFAWGVNSVHALQVWNGSQWVNISTPFTPANVPNAIAAVGLTSLALLDTSGGIHVSTDGGQHWSTILGTASSITGGGFTMFVRDSGGASYHVNLLVPSLTNTGSGNWDCAPSCPLGSYHTLTSTVYFGGRGGRSGPAGVTGKMSGNPDSTLAAGATEYATNCDLIFGNPNAPECIANYESHVNCSVMGPLVSAVVAFQFPKWEFVTTEAVWTPSLGAPIPNPTGYDYFWPVANHCTAATTPPDLNMDGQNVDWGHPFGGETYEAWLIKAFCIRLGNLPWVCSHGYASLLSVNIATVPYPCTHNP